MKKQYILNFDSLTDLEEFVSEIMKINADINGSYGKTVVDAKSFMGLVGISTHPVTVAINSDDIEEVTKFNEICGRYK